MRSQINASKAVHMKKKKRKTVPLQKMKEMEFGTAQPEKS